MRRLSAYALATTAAVLAPTRAYACPICGNHGDTTTTLIIYGIFMVIPFAIAGGVAWFIREQLRGVAAADESLGDEGDGGLAVPTPRPRSPRPVKPELIVSQS